MNDYIVLDIETTGLSPEYNKITEISGIKIRDHEICETYSQLINPETSIPDKITEITGIDDQMVEGQPVISEVISEFIDFCEGYVIMGHNIIFDYSFLKMNALSNGLSFEKQGVDTLYIAKYFLSNLRSRSLSALCDHYQIVRDHQHRAYDDALATYKIYRIFEKSYSNERTSKIFKPKQLQWKPKKQEPITNRQERYLLSLLKKYNLEMEKEVCGLSKSEASRKINQITFRYGK